jgi:RNA-binding protein 8A
VFPRAGADRTQGYALIEYAKKEEAESAIKGTTGTEFLEKTITT